MNESVVRFMIRQTLQLHLRYFATGIIYFFYFSLINLFLCLFLTGAWSTFFFLVSFFFLSVSPVLVHLLSTKEKPIPIHDDLALLPFDVVANRFDYYFFVDFSCGT